MNNKTNTLQSFKIVLLTFMLFFSSAVFAATVNVSTKAELEEAVSSASTPTEIIVSSGNYSGGNISLKGNTAPVIIQPATDFGVHFQSTVKIYGDAITIQKMNFDAGLEIYGNDIKVLRNIWDNASNDDWILIDTSAYRTEIGYNLFKNRSKNVPWGAQVIQQSLTENPSEPYQTHYHHNHFKNILPSTEYTEVIIIWSEGRETSPPAPDNGIIIEYNLWENARGGGKAVDNKTNGTIIRFNTLTGNNGFLKLRHGSRGLVDSNVFLGGSGGITLNDTDHVVINNYIDGSSNEEERGIQCYYGEKNPEQSESQYNKMVNTRIENNTLVTCGTGLELGAQGVSATEVMEDTVIKDNKFINCGSRATFRGGAEHKNTTWTNNKYKGNGGTYASKMTLDNSLVATPPSWTLTAADVGPDATEKSTEKSTEPSSGAYVISTGTLK